MTASSITISQPWVSVMFGSFRVRSSHRVLHSGRVRVKPLVVYACKSYVMSCHVVPVTHGVTHGVTLSNLYFRQRA